jgi:ADP-heptose:LPS heptosyltransferase
MDAERANRLLRALDRYVGIPAVYALGLLRRKRARPRAPRSIGILKEAAIGDTVLLSAFVRDLATAFPDAGIIFFAGRDNAPVARLIASRHSVVEIPVSNPVRALAEVRRHPVELLFDCGPWPRVNAVLSALSGARHTVGFRVRGQGRHFAHDTVIEHSDAVHELENYRGMLRGLGISTGSEPSLLAPAVEVQHLTGGREFVVCHMWSAGTGGWRKEWPEEHWLELIGALNAEGVDVMLTGSAMDGKRSAAFCDVAGSRGLRAKSVAGRIDLPQLCALLRLSRGVVSINTGVMHIAAALGVPTLSLEGPTSPGRWGPVGERCTSVVSPLPGCGYLYLGSEYSGRRPDCMAAIRVDDVATAFSELRGSRVATPSTMSITTGPAA